MLEAVMEVVMPLEDMVVQGKPVLMQAFQLRVV